MPSCGKDVRIVRTLRGILRVLSWVYCGLTLRLVHIGRKTTNIYTIKPPVTPLSFQHTKFAFLQIKDGFYPRFPQSLYLLTLHKNLKGF